MLMCSEVWVIQKFLDLSYDTVSIRVGHPLLGVHSCVLGGCGDGCCWDYKDVKKMTLLSSRTGEPP